MDKVSGRPDSRIQPEGGARKRARPLRAQVARPRRIRTRLETAIIVLVAVVIIGGAEVLLRAFDVPQYIMPKPSQIVWALYTEWPFLWPHLLDDTL